MRFLFFALVILVGAFARAAEPPSSFDFTAIPIGQVVTLYYKEVSKRPYVVCNDVLVDTRLASFRAAGRVLDGAGFNALLSAYGFEAVEKSGVVVVCKVPDTKAVEKSPVYDPFLYRVKHRDSGYLVDLIGPLVNGSFANKRQAVQALAVGGENVGAASPPGASGAGRSSPVTSSYSSATGDDFVVFTGPQSEVKKLTSLLQQLDTPVGEVVLKAYMYEVGKSASDASALDLVLSAVGNRFQVATVGDVVGNLVRLKTASVDLVASALSSDGRFKVVTAPFVRLRSGKTARFVSGGQQSVLGAIVTNQNGSTQQSFERIESGTILEVSPVVRGETVDVDLFQQVSSFVNEGAAASPTLNKRELRTSLSMADGEVVVLAGLNESKDEDKKSGLWFMPNFPLSKSKGSRSTELVLILELKRL